MAVGFRLMLVSLGLICLSFSLQGCGPTPKPAPAAKPRAPIEVLGAPCNVVTAEGCNPIQLPLVYLDGWDDGRVLLFIIFSTSQYAIS